MTYEVVTLGPEPGYSLVNVRQVYDAIAVRIAARGWVLEDTVDIVVSTQTYRRYVWKAPTAVTGLASDFFVIFEARFTTTGTVWATVSDALRIFVCKEYDAATNVGSKFVTVASATAITLNSDLTAPTSWDLDAVLPTTAGAIPLHMGLYVNNATTLAMQIAARADHFLASNGSVASSTYATVYVGAIESEMSASDDPLPVILGGGYGASAAGTSSNAGSTAALGQLVGFLTHPKLTPGGSYAYVFQGNYAPNHASGSNSGPMNYSDAVWTQGQLGGGSAPLFLGSGATKLPVASSGNTQTAASRGGRRGYLKGMRCTASTIGTGQDDKYSIDGVEYRSVYTGGNAAGTFIDATL